MNGYLDIETSFEGDVTVVGLLRHDRGLVQLVGDAVTADEVVGLMHGVDTVCTYNGEWFDLPVLKQRMGVDLVATHRSRDLALECRRRRLRGGLKVIEERLSIPRGLRGVNGYDAMLLWRRWTDGDRAALETLLAYNRDDVVNLALLERRLNGDLGATTPRAWTVLESPTGTGPSAAGSRSPARGTR